MSDDQTPAPHGGQDTPPTAGAPDGSQVAPPAPPTPPVPDAPAYAPPAYTAPTAPGSGAPAAPTYDGPPAPPYGAPAPDPSAPPAYGAQTYGAPAYGGQTYGAPAYGAPAYGTAPYAAAPYPASGYATVRTNVLSIISLVASIAGFLWIVPVIGPITAVITGHISLGQIKRTGEKGRGMALAGTIIGWVGVGTILLFVIGLFVSFAIASSQSSRYGA